MTRKARRTLDAFALPEEPVASEAAKQAVSTTTVGKASKQKQQLPTYLPHAAYEQLRKLAFDERVSMNTLVLEGIDLLFAHRGVVYLSPADKYHRLTHRPPKGQKGLDERAIMTSPWSSHPW